MIYVGDCQPEVLNPLEVHRAVANGSEKREILKNCATHLSRATKGLFDYFPAKRVNINHTHWFKHLRTIALMQAAPTINVSLKTQPSC